MQNAGVVTDILVRHRKPEKPWSIFPSSAVLHVPEPGTVFSAFSPSRAGLRGCRAEGSAGGVCSLSSASFSPGKAASGQTLECIAFVSVLHH